MKKVLFTLILISVSILFISSCKKNPTGSGQQTTFTTQQLQGTLVLSAASTVAADELNVITLANAANVGANGTFTVTSNNSIKYQLLFFNSKTTDAPIYLGLYDPISLKMMANDTSTALSLTLFNPLLIYSDQADRTEYLNAVKQSDKFSMLLAALNDAYQSDATKALDYNTNPKVYELSAQIMKDALIYLGGENKQIPIGDAPTITDAPGAGITFNNPSKIWYTAGIYPAGQDLKESVIIERQDLKTSLVWGWPPIVETDIKETIYSLGDGNSKIKITKGMDFTKIGQWDDPVGMATMLNTAELLAYIYELMVGEKPTPNYEKLANYLFVDQTRANQLSRDILNRDVEGFLTHFLHLLDENNLDLADWFWGGDASDATSKYMKTVSDMFKNVTFMSQILGYGDLKAPFIGDFFHSQKDITYNITQTNGTITYKSQNNPPTAEFTINPPAGVVSTSFTFDASITTDDLDPNSSLQYRWDFNSDGVWDTQWSNQMTTTYTYSEAGGYTINLEVKDTDSLVGAVSHSVNVGGGAGTATHVKLFRDDLPWDSNATVEVLQNLGFIEGQGTDTYEIINSSQMASVNLVPGQDLVIISNDQSDNFYDNYYNSQVRFNNFIYMGGSVLWEACDQGWAGGSIQDAGIILPGNLKINYNYDYTNYVTNQNLPLVAGLPQELDHNAASHESFTNYPDGTTIYTTNSSYEPTLIEFNLGGGWIIVSGQPLEHQYDHIYGSPDMEELLPRIISYFTGKTIGKPLHKQMLKQSVRPSH